MNTNINIDLEKESIHSNPSKLEESQNIPLKAFRAVFDFLARILGSRVFAGLCILAFMVLVILFIVGVIAGLMVKIIIMSLAVISSICLCRRIYKAFKKDKLVNNISI